jgi:2-polyprenyl-6-methoxyphenol hydroxylase-like FAD-dependent oxidoreductase
MSKINKILVVGASIAGPAVCYWLKKFGFSPTLIERHESIRPGGYAIDIRGVATSIVKKMGVYDKICDKRTALEKGQFVNKQGELLYEEYGEKIGFRQDDEVEIVRGDLVKILMETIPGIPCHFNQTISHIKEYDESVEVHFRDGGTEQFDILIGADGLHSNTREMSFGPDDYVLKNLGAYISVFSMPNYLKLSHTEITLETDGKLLQINSDRNPEIAQAGFLFRSNDVANNTRYQKEQKNCLKETFLNLGWESNNLLKLMEKTDDFYFDSITQVIMTSWTKGRVALVGDSGYCASPLSGQGTSLALVGAYLLAGELNKAKGNHTLAFKKYNELLHPFVKKNQQFGVWSSKTFLAPVKHDKKDAGKRTNEILKKLKIASNAITLPDYE